MDCTFCSSNSLFDNRVIIVNEEGGRQIWLCKDYPEISKHILLDDHWDITINDKVYKDVSLSELKFPAVEKGDVVVMQRQLPKDWDMIEGALRLHIRHSAVKMYIQDKQVYEYGYGRLKANKTVGSGFQFINFPNQYKGKKLTITLYVAENHAFSKFDAIQLYEWDHAYRAFLTENRLPMFLGSFLVIFGLSVLMITAIALLFSRKVCKNVMSCSVFYLYGIMDFVLL